MKEELIYFKQELFSIPKAREADYRQKYAEYQERVQDYEVQVKRLELVVRGDEVGLLMLDQGIDKDSEGGRRTGGMYEN
jgi:hypothetical protein